MWVYQRTMWVKQCHWHHPWLGMVNIPPVKMVMTGGWFRNADRWTAWTVWLWGREPKRELFKKPLLERCHHLQRGSIMLNSQSKSRISWTWTICLVLFQAVLFRKNPRKTSPGSHFSAGFWSWCQVPCAVSKSSHRLQYPPKKIEKNHGFTIMTSWC